MLVFFCLLLIVFVFCYFSFVFAYFFLPKVLYSSVVFLFFVMAVVKLSRSGKQLQFVLSEDLPAGSVLGVSWQSLKGHIGSSPFMVLTRMPFGVAPNRFPESPVFDDGSDLSRFTDRGSGSASEDSFSKKFVESRDLKRKYSGGFDGEIEF